jgi:hypothetical protein
MVESTFSQKKRSTILPVGGKGKRLEKCPFNKVFENFQNHLKQYRQNDHEFKICLFCMERSNYPNVKPVDREQINKRLSRLDK